MEQYVGLVLLFVGGAALIVLWTLASSMLVAESTVITPRVQRGLPQSFFARATFGWLTPGPETGLVFAVINMIFITVPRWQKTQYTLTLRYFNPR